MKRFFSFLLVVAMVMGMIVLPASAEEVVETPKVCPHCNTAWDACNWTPWVAEDTENSVLSGHYYLDEELDMTARYKIGTAKGQGQELAVDVCIDLRGYSMTQTTSNTRAFYVFDHCTFAVMDTVGGGQIVGTARGDDGGTIYVRTNGVLQLHSGALVNAQKNRLRDGGVIFVENGGTFEMRGGIVDGSGVTVQTDYTKNGSAIYCAGNVNIYDGMILGGSANFGGTFYVSETGVVNVFGGTVMGGTSVSHGGSIYNLGKLHVSGGLITGGYAPKGRGGNIYSSGDVAQLLITGGIIENGQADSSGGNIAAYNGSVEITGGTIRGNVYFKTDATLSGAPVINHCDYEGLTLVKENILTVKDLTEGADIILQGDGVMTDASVSPNVSEYLEKGYLTPASRYGLKVEEGALVGTTDGNGYCPHCGQEVIWSRYTPSTASSGHYYTSSTTELPEGSAGLTIGTGVDIVLNLISGGIKPATPYQVAGKLSILSSVSSAKRMFTTATATEANGATFYVTGTLNLYDGVLGPAANTDTVTTGEGGVIYADNGKVNVYGGLIMGATAAKGGTIVLQGTKASPQAQLNMFSGVIRDGVATGGGGNIIMEYAKVNIENGLVLNGKANNGANLYNDGGTSSLLTIRGGIISQGTAANFGGNLYHSATNSKTTMYDGLLYNGVGKSGGNGYINNGVFNVYGGKLYAGVANSADGGNIHANAGKYYIEKEENIDKNYTYIGDNDLTDAIAAPQIIGGRATTNGGNIYATGNLKLGKCHIAGGKVKNGDDDLQLGDLAYMTVEPAFDSTLVMSLSGVRLAQLEVNRELLNTFCTELNGKLYVRNYNMAMLVQSEKDTLTLAGAALIDRATGEPTWYPVAQGAVDAYTEDYYIRLYAPENTVEITDDVVVDLNGSVLTAGGSGKLYGFDSANDTYESFGSAVVNGPAVAPAFLAPNGNQYITIENDNGISFHRLGIGITHASVRTACAGIYYRAVWECDPVLQEKIMSCGVAVSVQDMPGSDFASDEDTLYTAFAADSFVSGEAKTGVMIENILRKDGDNWERGLQSIYAAAYAVLDDGTEEGTVIMGNQNVGYSMADVLRNVDHIWPRLTEGQKTLMKELYNMDPDTMKNWSLYNLMADINGTPSVRPLKVLSIGNSTDVDAIHMLNLIAAAEGYDQELVIGILYYSGCKMNQHVDFIQNNTDAYALYISSTLTPDVPAVRYPGTTMYEGLQYTDWDIIVLHEDDLRSDKETYFTNGNIQFVQNYVNQNKRNPEAVFGWHIPWVNPDDPDLLSTYPNKSNGYVSAIERHGGRVPFFNAVLENTGKYVFTDNSFTYIIPAGTAMLNADTSYLTQKDLHRDYYHNTDLGRVIAAYVWYCTIAGVDRLEEIKLDAIPVAFFRTTKSDTDRPITDAEKAIILESVNNALANPLEITQSQYTVAP
ncbi:MAG: DUF4886 domain-containing protein [Oscillospiraceae bacterium]|nr:DUF4886 domain-containing protein [Oscillospiraceae bacterium]